MSISFDDIDHKLKSTDECRISRYALGAKVQAYWDLMSDLIKLYERSIAEYEKRTDLKEWEKENKAFMTSELYTFKRLRDIYCVHGLPKLECACCNPKPVKHLLTCKMEDKTEINTPGFSMSSSPDDFESHPKDSPYAIGAMIQAFWHEMNDITSSHHRDIRNLESRESLEDWEKEHKQTLEDQIAIIDSLSDTYSKYFTDIIEYRS